MLLPCFRKRMSPFDGVGGVAVIAVAVVLGGVENAVVSQLVQDRREHPVVQLEDRVSLTVHYPTSQRRLVAAHLAL